MGIVVKEPPVRKKVKEIAAKQGVFFPIVETDITRKLWNPAQYLTVDTMRVPFETAVKVVAKSDWAYKTAEGMVQKLFGLMPGMPDYEETVKRVSEKIARGALT